MKIGVLGSGIVGQVLASGFLKHGHEAMLSSRDAEKAELRKWREENPGGQTGTFEEAAKFGDAVVLATLGRAAANALDLAGHANLAGKIVIDTTNPIAEEPPMDGVLAFTTGPNESLGEQLQAHVPQARVVKAFNSVGYGRMIDPRFEQGPPTMFICGDDAAAKAQVSDILRQFGWEPCDCGGIRASRAIEPLCILWCIPGFLRGQWDHAFKLLAK